MNCGGLLRRELSDRAQQYARERGLPYSLSYGQPPTVCFDCNEGARHGNFMPAVYTAILRKANWRRRLQKVHSQGRKSLPRNERGVWRELDACTSSDALLMNVFCYPGVFKDGRVASLLGLNSAENPDFGFRARVPLANGRLDRTEVDMRLGDLLVEAKLTESDFQRVPKKRLSEYKDFDVVFDCEALPQTEREYLSYQLIRSVLAAFAGNCSFCVIADARKPELVEAWYEVMKCVKPVELRPRCKVLSWQELAKVLPARQRLFLHEKYGIG